MCVCECFSRVSWRLASRPVVTCVGENAGLFSDARHLCFWRALDQSAQAGAGYSHLVQYWRAAPEPPRAKPTAQNQIRFFFSENRRPERGTREKNGEPTRLSDAELTKNGGTDDQKYTFPESVLFRSSIGGNTSRTSRTGVHLIYLATSWASVPQLGLQVR